MTESGAARVSVIVPVYNRERYVRECVESILATGYPNLEVLIVDDGSTDATPAILASIAEANPDVVRVIRHPDGANLGQKPSVNLAISLSSGTLVCFLDSDDLMRPYRFERAVPLLDRDPDLDGVIEVTELFFETPAQLERWGDRAARYGPKVKAIPADDFVRACLLERTCSMHTSNILVRRGLFERSGVYRPTRERSEDFHLWLRMAASGRFAVGETARAVTLYRRHDDNIWNPGRRDSVRDVHVLADVLSWARESPHVSEVNVAVLREAYRRKARWCLAALRLEGDRRGLARLARELLREDPSWALDRGFVGNLGRGLFARSRPTESEARPT